MEEVKIRRISDKEVYEAIEAVKKNEENSMAKALVALLAVTVDTRAFLRKLYKELVPARNIVTDPTKAKENDIVVGKK
jgi:hypothetical protein